jgi:ubiquinone/menaquinone biosynthesis C-methylase UbiE
MKNQQQLWNEIHTQRKLARYSFSATDFANEVEKIITPNSEMLELGCGLGNDSTFFAAHGHNVVATDFSEVAIQNNNGKYAAIENVTFTVVDMSATPYQFESNRFDAVYARLSLHYFSDEVTRKIVSEIHRILQPNGYFCFMSKSVEDPEYGKGEKLEENMYVNEGRVRHFFTEEYTKDILKDVFEIVKIESKKEDLYGQKSGYVKVIAKKIENSPHLVQ